MLQLLSATACLHPIRTICIIAVLASTTHVWITREHWGLLHGTADKADWTTMTAATPGRQLMTGPETGWTWHHFEAPPQATEHPLVFTQNTAPKHLALVTLDFPALHPAEQAALSSSVLGSSMLATNLSAASLPSTSSSTLVISVPYTHTTAFLDAIKTVSYESPVAGHLAGMTRQEGERKEEGMDRTWWMMRPDANTAARSLAQQLPRGWAHLVDQLEQAEAMDIVLITLGYVAMLRTFLSLFLGMKRMGSQVWLATSVLLSSTFAFLFGLAVTLRLGVPISIVTLSEGLPFLVTMVGFEKNILLTSAVLSYAMEHRTTQQQQQHQQPQSPVQETQAERATSKRTPRQRRNSNRNKNTTSSDDGNDAIHYAVRSAIRDTGHPIVVNYALEISLLAAGAASGVPHLQPFCILALFTLLFDGVLLFTLYTAVLCVKVEVNRIKRLVDMRRALEDDGLSPRIAERVAQSHDRQQNHQLLHHWALLGAGQPDATVLRFKVAMLAGFVALNVGLVSVQASTAGWSLRAAVATERLTTTTTALSDALWGWAVDALEHVRRDAQGRGQATWVTVMPPLSYERANLAVTAGTWDAVLSQWTLLALVLSIGLNGYLFQTTRLEIKETPSNDNNNDDDASIDTAITSREPSASHQRNLSGLHDEAIIDLCLRGHVAGHSLERRLGDCARAVRIRRAVVARHPVTRSRPAALLEQWDTKLPHKDYDWARVLGACCENVIGYTPVPVGVAGPLVLDGRAYFVPMATTEGVLVASTSRGSKAINLGGGAVTVVTGDGMTRAPCVRLDTLARAGEAKAWLDSAAGLAVVKKAFEATSRYLRLTGVRTTLAGSNLYIRFQATTGDAMGMNMISKGVEQALAAMQAEGEFPDMTIVTLSSNYCADKKPAAINWVCGRGKGVVAEATIPAAVVRDVLKSDVDGMVDLAVAKLLVGSAMAGATGGFNANAANLVAAVFLATGQDPAQVVEGANCITTMKKYVFPSLSPCYAKTTLLILYIEPATAPSRSPCPCPPSKSAPSAVERFSSRKAPCWNSSGCAAPTRQRRARMRASSLALLAVLCWRSSCRCVRRSRRVILSRRTWRTTARRRRRRCLRGARRRRGVSPVPERRGDLRGDS